MDDNSYFDETDPIIRCILDFNPNMQSRIMLKVKLEIHVKVDRRSHNNRKNRIDIIQKIIIID
jgi:hypothetical protein